MLGKSFSTGIDENGDPVYTIGRRSSKLVVPAMKNLIVLIQSKHPFDEQVIFSNTSPTVPIPMTIGGFLSRGLKINFLGVPLLVIGAKQCCDNIFRLVDNTKRVAQSTQEKVTILENQEFK